MGDGQGGPPPPEAVAPPDAAAIVDSGLFESPVVRRLIDSRPAASVRKHYLNILQVARRA
jgi:hypothetical protein